MYITYTSIYIMYTSIYISCLAADNNYHGDLGKAHESRSLPLTSPPIPSATNPLFRRGGLIHFSTPRFFCILYCRELNPFWLNWLHSASKRTANI